MEEAKSYEEKFEKIKEIYDQLTGMIQSNGINLVNDQNLNNMIVSLCQRFELKMKSKLTLGVIFDCKYNEPCLIDALLNEKVSPLLDSKYPYVIQGEESVKETRVDHSSKDIKMISVPNEKWKYFNNSVMLLSNNDFKDFLSQISLKSVFDPDVLVLVLKSADELQDPKIQSFISSIKNQNFDPTFLLVLNDAESIDCTAYDYCDVCYPENVRQYLQDAQMNLENRIFKISASKILRSGGDPQAMSAENEHLAKNFTDFKEVFQRDLDIDNVMDRFYRTAQVIGESMDELRKTFDENKLKEVITECETSLVKESSGVIEDIQNQKSNTLKDVKQIFDDRNNDENEFLRSILKKVMKQKCGNLRQDLEGKITKIIQKIKDKNYNKEVSAMSRNIFTKEYLNEEKLENNIDDFISNEIDEFKLMDIKKENMDFGKINVEEIDFDKLRNSANQKEKKQAKTVLYKFLYSWKTAIFKIYNVAENAYKIFTAAFKKKVVNVVEDVKKTIDFTVKFSKELHLRHMVKECRKMKQVIETKRKQIRDGIHLHVDLINDKLISIDNEDLKSEKMGNLLGDLMENFEKSCNMAALKHELYTQMQNTGSSELSQKITDHFADQYQKKYLTSAEVDKFDKQIKDQMGKLYKKIDEKKFYVHSKEDFFDIDNENPKTLEELNVMKKEKRSIKTSELMMQLHSTTNDMVTLLNETSNKLNEGIDKFILYMKNYSFEVAV